MREAFDQDALVASLDLVGRAGAKSIEFGYLDDDVPIEQARWWAHAQYLGRRVQVQDERGPVQAVEALARILLAGARCRRCGEAIVLNDSESGCRWRRLGAKWEPGCGKPINQTIPLPR